MKKISLLLTFVLLATSCGATRDSSETGSDNSSETAGPTTSLETAGPIDMEAFAAIAKEKSTEPAAAQSGGSLGCAPAEKYVPEFTNVMVNAPTGELVAPFESQFGWHVLIVEETKINDVEPSLLAQGASQEFLATVDIKIDPSIGEWQPEQATVIPKFFLEQQQQALPSEDDESDPSTPPSTTVPPIVELPDTQIATLTSDELTRTIDGKEVKALIAAAKEYESDQLYTVPEDANQETYGILSSFVLLKSLQLDLEQRSIEVTDEGIAKMKEEFVENTKELPLTRDAKDIIEDDNTYISFIIEIESSLQALADTLPAEQETQYCASHILSASEEESQAIFDELANN